MALGTAYVALFDKLKTTIEGITVNATVVFPTVIQGIQEKISSYPTVFIDPQPIRIASISPEKSEYVCTFHIYVVVKNPDYKAGLKDAIEKIGLINDELIKDRTLGEKCQRLETLFIDVVRERELLRHWSLLRVDCVLYL